MQVSPGLEELMNRDPRYAPEAYEFVMAALAYTVKQINERRHITGRELLFGIRDFALDCWGLMARHVLESWGIRSTDDFGDIVFNLVSVGMLSKTDRDNKEDFKNVFKFVEAFDKSYSPTLDEHGHVRRKAAFVPPGESVTWAPFFGAAGLLN